VRLFQNAGLPPSYLSRLNDLAKTETTFSGRLAAFLDDRFGASHLLKPALEGDAAAFFTNADDQVLQRLWASEQSLRMTASLEEILLAQIEEHKTEIFYNLDPMRYGSDFIRKLPGCVRTTIAWRAAPSPGADFGAYDAVVCNFPGILSDYRRRGWRGEYFSPAHDPAMDAYAANDDRTIDVLFIGSYSRHHLRRAKVLDGVASLRNRFNVVFCLDRSRLTRLVESPLFEFLPVKSGRRPPDTVAVTEGPVFGRELYAKIASAKVVLNSAVDMAGADRGNMRCFEATGCGALMVSDSGNYPQGFADMETMMVFETDEKATAVIEDALQNGERSRQIAAQAHRMVAGQYNKDRQWNDFKNLVDRL
jgi:glycosyl transferase family 1